MGEKTEAEGGGNQRARSARLKKEREAAEARRRAEARKPMRSDSRSDRQQMADMSGTRSPKTQELLNNQRRVKQTQDSIEELTARRDDTRNPIARMNLDNQIRELKAGGTPVTTEFARGGARAGEILTVGVVRGGRYSGRQGFDPGSGNVRMNPNTGTYQSVYGRGGTSRSSGSGRATTPAAAPSQSTPQIAVPTIGDDTADAQRRAMLSGGAGAASRRKYINR